MNKPGNRDELLEATGGTYGASTQPSWTCYNLRAAGTDTEDQGLFASFQRVQVSESGNLSQIFNLPDSDRDVQLVATADVRASGDAGLNIYLYTHADEAAPVKVYQVAHPGDGEWHTLSKTFAVPGGTIRRIKLMVVLRSGDGPLHVRSLLLRRKADTLALDKNLERLHISQAYHDAVVHLVDRHPAAGDPDFRDRLYRSLAGSNRKGIRTVEAILRRLRPAGFSLEGGRFLDLGCGTGGSLVGARVGGAVHCEGWEINNEKLALARLNTRSLYDEDAAIKIHSKSVEDPVSTGAGSQPGNLVFCEEVLEHVKDVSAAIATLARCLDQEHGVAYVTIPAGYALESVLADPHLKLFGITLLDRFEAQPFATALKHHTHYSDMMGGYLWYSEYCQQFTNAGLVYVPIHAEPHKRKTVAAAGKQLESIRGQRAAIRAAWGESIGESDLTLLEARLDGYIDGAATAFAEASARNATDAARLQFMQEYGVPHLEFLLAPAGSTILNGVKSG